MVVATVARVWNGLQVARSSPEERAIQRVILGARSADIGLAVIPRAYQSSRLPEGVADHMKRRVDTECKKYYVDRVLSDCLVLHKLQIREDVDGRFLVLEGKVSSIKYGNIDVAGSKATGSAVITEAVTTAQQLRGRRHVLQSRNTVEFAYRLVKRADAWKITAVDGGYVPGKGP